VNVHDNRLPLPGSNRTPVPGASPVGSVDPGEEVTVTVLLRRRSGAQLPGLTEGRDSGRGPIPREEFAASFGADPSDVDAIRAFAAGHHLDVGQVNLAGRTVSLTGTADAMSDAFGVQLRRYRHPGGEYRGREGAITLPADIAGIVEGIFGLDDRPQARPRIRLLPREAGVAEPHVAKSFKVPEIAQLYSFPSDVNGTGQCIAILEFGGGYQDTDLQEFFQGLNISAPAVSAVSVDGVQNKFGDPANSQSDANADGEVALDIEVAGAVAPGASIAVYFAPNNDQGWIDAITTAVHDTTNNPSIISISWGGPEDTWTDQTQKALDSAFEDAGLLGVTVFVAAGDHGSADRPPITTDENGNPVANPAYDGLAHVDFPASSPNVVACGGTHLEGDAAVISTETVWNDGDGWATGGGVSDPFDLPAWQANMNVPTTVNLPGTRIGRGVPDVSGNADNSTGYLIHFNGNDATVGGTSAVAPLWAGLMALLNQSTGTKPGFINDLLYSMAPAAFQGITDGTNAIPAVTSGAVTQQATAGYPAGSGWDACTGLGSPNGQALQTAFVQHFQQSLGPAVTTISPATGNSAGGDSVTVTGSGFTGATDVGFGSTDAASMNVDSDTQITATSPAGTGTVDVTVTTPAGTSATGPDSQFTYT
jgi:kumamolisin